MVVRNCWHCHAYANMSLPALQEHFLYETGTDLIDCTFPKPDKMQEGDDNYFVIYQCDRCGYPNIAHYKHNRWDDDNDEPTLPIEWIPISAIGKEYPDVPKRVTSAASECHRCFSIGAYRATVIMARSVLEAIITEKIQDPANEHGKDKTLNMKLKDAADEGVISKRLGDLADAIKDIGNGSTHNIFEDISKDEADYVLGFMDLLIEETYQQDERLAKLAKLNQRLEQVKSDKLSGIVKEN
ncbi:DUF4145 domain-containing protein [Bifidobacterium samirii]|uniref:DUF4145 domain-containing protein n=1 Tax=Bifidobacterium samirii TaxID=2306974 RepID=A0A430FJC5_9BIFI|nr:DUF4145 domain-containing protein [Bifidobacterium samirii]RSX52983.1 hypothetical protein D2E24_1654 [Bifidobacterium samirii]